MKRLVVCCDGTWNRPDQRFPTNVVKFVAAVARSGDGVEQRLHYEAGVGTTRGERLLGGIFGYGLSRNVRDAYRFLVAHFEPGDELWFLGFSRGAFTARSAAGFVRNCGVLRPADADRVDEAYALYRRRDAAPSSVEAQEFRRAHSYETPIRFIGVWDTVGALGIPGRRLSFLNRTTRFHDTELSSRVSAGFHALAVDERRRPFKPTIWHTDPAADQTVEQVWFAGVHSDVGGGYADTGLADLALEWMLARAVEHGLVLDRGPLERGEWERGGTGPRPDPLATKHESYEKFYRLTRPYHRPLVAVSPETEDVATPVDVRWERDPSYRPTNLRDYLEKVGSPD